MVRGSLDLPDDGLDIALQGFGNAGSWFAKAAVEAGHKIVAVSDSSGMVRNDDGLDVNEIFKLKADGGSITDLDGDSGDAENLIAEECDVLALAALGGAVDASNADRLNCKAVVEIANIPILAEADEPLRKRGIEVVPDILANGGGVTVSHAEWAQNREGLAWSEERVQDYLEERMKTAAKRVTDLMQEKDIDMRTAAYGAAMLRLCGAISAAGTAEDFRTA